MVVSFLVTISQKKFKKLKMMVFFPFEWWFIIRLINGGFKNGDVLDSSKISHLRGFAFATLAKNIAM